MDPLMVFGMIVIAMWQFNNQPDTTTMEDPAPIVQPVEVEAPSSAPATSPKPPVKPAAKPTVVETTVEETPAVVGPAQENQPNAPTQELVTDAPEVLPATTPVHTDCPNAPAPVTLKQ